MQITVGSSNTVNVKLAVKGESTQITVTADDFAGVHLEKPEVAAVIETDQILSLPTLDRNPYSLVAFSGNLSSDPTATARGVGFNISGSRSTSVDILLDGAENTDLYAVGIGQTVPMDATSEIRIVTSNSGAEYGRGSGAVNVSTKSGTNGLHGSVYEFNRVSTLASDGYNNNYLHALYGIAGQAALHPQPVRLLRRRPDQEGQAVLLLLHRVDPHRQRAEHGGDGAHLGPDRHGRAQHAGVFRDSTASWRIPSTARPTMGGDTRRDKRVRATTSTSSPPPNPAILTTPSSASRSTRYRPTPAAALPVNQWISFNRADWTINQTTSMFVRYIQESAVNPAGYQQRQPVRRLQHRHTQYNHNLEISFSKAFTPTLRFGTKLLGSRYNNAQPLGTAPVSPTLYVNAGSP